MSSIIHCHHCHAKLAVSNSAFNRARKINANLYCDRECSGMGRRKHKTAEQKKEEKRLYDIEYRKTNRERKKITNAAWHNRTYDPVKAAEKRKQRMPKHIEYCRRQEYKDWKSSYDKQYRAKRQYGEMWECAILLNKIEQEIISRMDRYEIYQSNGTLNKRLQRRRDYGKLNSNQS